MIGKLINRLLQGIVVLFVLYTLTFFLIRALPYGPFQTEKAIPAHVIEKLKAQLGLDQPLHVQYVRPLKNMLLDGDLGVSTRLEGLPVIEIIEQAFPVSIHLGVMAMILAMLLGLPAGVISAYKKNSMVDYLVMAVAMFGLCLPSFVNGPLLSEYLGRSKQIFPVMGWDPLQVSTWVMPVFTLALGYAAYLARLTRSGVLDVLSQDFVRTARAKGVSTVKILVKHCLRGGLIPSAAYIGPAFAGIISGSLVIEAVFQVPGLGRHFIKAIETSDANVIMGIVLLYGALVTLGNIASDFLIAWLNPLSRAQS
jgi:oligopeptide transport system permease protein